VPHEEYLRAHARILDQPEWIIDGYGDRGSAWARFAVADTLIHVDLPVRTHLLWVTKRLIKGIWVTPEGWPDKSPMLASTLDSYRVIWRCHRHLTPRYRAYVAEMRDRKRVQRLRSPREMRAFLAAVEQEVATE